MTLARLLRLLPAFLLAGVLVGSWTSLPLPSAAGGPADPALDQMHRLLELKSRAYTIHLRAEQVAPRLPQAPLRAKALAISHQAKELHDRAEKQLYGR